MMKWRSMARIGLLCAWAGLALGAQAQDFPAKPITMVMPYAPGGPGDVITRVFAAAMQKPLGQQIVVENPAGASGTIGTTKVARAKADGYTLLMIHVSHATNQAMYKGLPYHPVDDFEPIGRATSGPMLVAARNGFPAKNLAEFVPYVKANASKISLAHAGVGSASHLCGLMLQNALGVKFNEIPYKGTGPALNDLLGGQVDLLCDQTTQTVPMIKENRIKVYGVTTTKRLSALPNVPTLDEQGNKGFEVKVWHGMYAPKGTPKDAIDKLNAALRAALNDPSVKQRLADLSSEIPPMDKITPEGLRTHLEAEIKKWGPVITKAGIYAD